MKIYAIKVYYDNGGGYEDRHEGTTYIGYYASRELVLKAFESLDYGDVLNEAITDCREYSHCWWAEEDICKYKVESGVTEEGYEDRSTIVLFGPGEPCMRSYIRCYIVEIDVLEH